MKLTNMRLPAEPASEAPTPAPPDGPRYPYGLCLTLEEAALEKLGVTELPAVDSDVLVLAKAKVTGVRSNAYQGGEQMRSVDLQITDLAVTPFPADDAAKFWPKE